MGLWELGLHSIPPHVRPEFDKSKAVLYYTSNALYNGYDFYEKFKPMLVGSLNLDQILVDFWITYISMHKIDEVS
jgi:hypothetical protein